MKRLCLAFPLVAVLALPACVFTAWQPVGLYACEPDGSCERGFICDDGVCCRLGGTPACPTRPVDGRCPNGNSATTYYRDLDSDGFGATDVTELFCSKPTRESWSTLSGDCDDSRPTVKPHLPDQPAQPEACNGLDDDCDGQIDNGGTNRRTNYYFDEDGDGYGATDAGRAPILACVVAADAGYVPVAGDCRPNDPAFNPGAPELCNGIDDNCNGRVDEGPFGDDFFDVGIDAPTVAECDNAGMGECRQGNYRCVSGARVCVSRVVPSSDVCDGKDNDCNGVPDDPPGCGGPRSFLSAAGSVIAQRMRVPSLPFVSSSSSCFLGYAGVPGEPPKPAVWVSPSWNTTTPLQADYNNGTAASFVQLWSFSAPPNEVWDLETPDGVTLELPLTLTSPVNYFEADGGLPPSEFWGDATRFSNPVINLCAADGSLLRRLTPAVVSIPSSGLWAGGVKIPLLASGNGWVVSGTGALKAVTRVEVLMSNHTIKDPTPSAGNFVTCRVIIEPGAGFIRGPH